MILPDQRIQFDYAHPGPARRGQRAAPGSSTSSYIPGRARFVDAPPEGDDPGRRGRARGAAWLALRSSPHTGAEYSDPAQMASTSPGTSLLSSTMTSVSTPTTSLRFSTSMTRRSTPTSEDITGYIVNQRLDPATSPRWKSISPTTAFHQLPDRALRLRNRIPINRYLSAPILRESATSTSWAGTADLWRRDVFTVDRLHFHLLLRL